MKKIHLLFSCIISGIFLAGSVTSASKPTATGSSKEQIQTKLTSMIPGWIKKNTNYSLLINSYITAIVNKNQKNKDILSEKICGKGGMFRKGDGKNCADFDTWKFARAICLGHKGSFFGGQAFKDSKCANNPISMQKYNDEKRASFFEKRTKQTISELEKQKKELENKTDDVESKQQIQKLQNKINTWNKRIDESKQRLISQQDDSVKEAPANTAKKNSHFVIRFNFSSSNKNKSNKEKSIKDSNSSKNTSISKEQNFITTENGKKEENEINKINETEKNKSELNKEEIEIKNKLLQDEQGTDTQETTLLKKEIDVKKKNSNQDTSTNEKLEEDITKKNDSNIKDKKNENAKTDDKALTNVDNTN